MATVRIGEREVDVDTAKAEWALALMEKGVIVDLTITQWRGTAKLSPSDLGITYSDPEIKDFMDKYIRLGTERLLPPAIRAELSRLTNLGRSCLENHSFDTVWGRFVPFSVFELWYDENQTLQRMYYNYASEFAARRNEIAGMIANEYRKMATDVWRRIYPSSGEAPESFITQFTDNIVAKIPDENEMLTMFKYEATFLSIPLPTIIQQNIEQAKSIERESVKKDYEAELERRARQRITDEYVTKKQEIIGGFLNSTVNYLRKCIQDLCLDALDSLGKARVKGLGLQQKTRILNVIEKVEKLNFYNDEEINKIIAELRMETLRVKGEDDKEDLVATLQRIVEVTSEEFTPKDFNPSVDYLEV